MDVNRTCALFGDVQLLNTPEAEKAARANVLNALMRREIDHLLRLGYRRFLCGFSGPGDFALAEAVLEARQRNPDIRLESVLAYEEEAAAWKETARERYFRLLGLCNAEYCLRTRFETGCLSARNRTMVDRAGTLLIVSDGLLGNAAQAAAYAARRGKPVVRIRPARLASRKSG